MKRNLIMLTVALLFTGCAAMDQYDRSYSIGYEDEQGHRLNTGVTLHPRDKKPVRRVKPSKSVSTIFREIFIDPYPGPDYPTCSLYVPVIF